MAVNISALFFLLFHRGEIHDLREVAEQLESERFMLGKKVDRTEKELKKMTKQWQESVETIAELKEKINKVTTSCISAHHIFISLV